MPATNVRSLFLVQHSLGSLFLFYPPSLCYSQVLERLDRDEAPQSPSQADRLIHLRSQAATISLQESLYPPSYRRCYLSTGKYHGNKPSLTPAPLWRRRTAPAELWGSPRKNRSCPRKTKTEEKNASQDECAEECRTHFGRSEKSHCSSSTPAPRSAPENCSHHTHRHFVKVDQPLRSATLLSSCARRWRDAGSLKKVQQICSEKGLFVTQRSFQKKQTIKKRTKICLLVGADGKVVQRAVASACV